MTPSFLVRNWLDTGVLPVQRVSFDEFWNTESFREKTVSSAQFLDLSHLGGHAYCRVEY